MPRLFPKGFYWGTSISSHQTEGGLHNDWTAWEKKQANALAAAAARKYRSVSPVWETIKSQAENPANYRSEEATDFFHRYEQDIATAAALGITAFRFSIDWSRLEPEMGKYDESAFKFYARVIACLRKYTLEPFLCLWHWPLPVWLSRRGGWLAPESISRFEQLTRLIARLCSPSVKYWITLNEPLIYTYFGYITAEWPPQKRNPRIAWKILTALHHAHVAAYRAIKAQRADASVGIAHHLIDFQTHKTLNPIRHLATYQCSQLWNHWFIKKNDAYQDYIGVNHYIRKVIGPNSRKSPWISDLGWELWPKSIYNALRQLRRYRKPVIVLENGLADAGDRYRKWYIRAVLHWVHRAIATGVDVRGYFHWSLLDNFEWDKGFWPRFGLLAVDYTTKARTARPSAELYGRICRNNCLP